MSKPKNSEATWEFVHRMDTLALEKLTSEVERLNEALKDEQAVSGHRADEVSHLKAENERLRKAGDWMYNAIILNSYKDLGEAMKNWNAAKEGKSV